MIIKYPEEVPHRYSPQLQSSSSGPICGRVPPRGSLGGDAAFLWLWRKGENQIPPPHHPNKHQARNGASKTHSPPCGSLWPGNGLHVEGGESPPKNREAAGTVGPTGRSGVPQIGLGGTLGKGNLAAAAITSTCGSAKHLLKGGQGQVRTLWPESCRFKGGGSGSPGNGKGQWNWGDKLSNGDRGNGIRKKWPRAYARGPPDASLCRHLTLCWRGGTGPLIVEIPDLPITRGSSCN